MYQDKEFKKVILFALLAYVIWCTLLLYWALIHDVDPIETLMYQIVLSLLFMLLLLPIIGQWQRFAQDMAQLTAKPFNLLI
ncbi:EamA family transporter RarD, partial [Staphylococcus pseudintermedius]